MSPRPSPCDGLSGNLPAFVDRELPDEQTQAVEKHLDGCGACQGRVRELEAVSAVLKAWDAQVPAGPPAPQRLRHAVLARVEELGSGMRRARRARWISALAVAASLLVALGVPLALGLARERPTEPPRFERLEGGVAGAAAALPKPLELARLDPARLAHRPWDAPAPAAGADASDAEREAFLRGALEAQRELEEEARFARLSGMRGVWVTDRESGRRLLVSPEAAHAFEPGELLDWLRECRDAPYYPPAPDAPRTAGLASADLLGHLLPEPEALEEWRRERRLLTYRRPGGAGTVLTLYRLASASAATPQGPEVLDPLEAQAQGRLRLEATGVDALALNAVVEGTTLPILIPAGQLLTGGEDDRVVARDVWLPAGAGRRVVRVACLSVRSGPRRPEADVALAPWVAGPGLRALLARGAQASAVLEHCRRLRGLATGGRVPLEWSLLDLYDAPTESQVLASREFARALEAAAHGFVALDAEERWVGLEHLTLRGPGALALRMRLAHGYEHEARVNALGKSAAPASREPLGRAFERLRTNFTPLQETLLPPEAQVEGVSHAALAPPAPAPSLQTLRVDGRRVRVTALAAE